MIKTDIKVYKVIVENSDARATLICVTYRMSMSEPHYSAEFYTLVSNFNDSDFKIPNGNHTFTFQEELRMFLTAVRIAPDNRESNEEWIKTKMNEAFGNESKIIVKDFITT